MELVWSNALLYNSDPAHLVYVACALGSGLCFLVLMLMPRFSGIKLLCAAEMSFGEVGHCWIFSLKLLLNKRETVGARGFCSLDKEIIYEQDYCTGMQGVSTCTIKKRY